MAQYSGIEKKKEKRKRGSLYNRKSIQGDRKRLYKMC